MGAGNSTSTRTSSLGGVSGKGQAPTAPASSSNTGQGAIPISAAAPQVAAASQRTHPGGGETASPQPFGDADDAALRRRARHRLSAVAVLQTPEIEALPQGLPAPNWGSDHVCLVTQFVLQSGMEQ